jgi:D-aminoacyl-tRNA deacylase
MAFFEEMRMIALLQRVSAASVVVEGATIGCIGPGLLVFVGVERDDSEIEADRLVERLLGYRMFADAAGKMNRSVTDVDGGVLLVPQFTLGADTDSGTRPSFTPAATPDVGERLFHYAVRRTRERHAQLAVGKFGAHMQVALTNDGPVTFWLRVKPEARERSRRGG